jgi:transcriptional regulator with XRE-family HTH domain
MAHLQSQIRVAMRVLRGRARGLTGLTMRDNMHYEGIRVKGKIPTDGLDSGLGDGQAQPMVSSTSRRIFIREWRKHRGFTQEQLAKASGLSQSNLSRLERGDQEYTQGNLEALAAALECQPVDLIWRAPDSSGSAETEIQAAFRRMSAEDKRQALEIFRVIASRKPN